AYVFDSPLSGEVGIEVVEVLQQPRADRRERAVREAPNLGGVAAEVDRCIRGVGRVAIQGPAHDAQRDRAVQKVSRIDVPIRAVAGPLDDRFPLRGGFANDACHAASTLIPMTLPL